MDWRRLVPCTEEIQRWQRMECGGDQIASAMSGLQFRLGVVMKDPRT
jgi:hypothetical protein